MKFDVQYLYPKSLKTGGPDEYYMQMYGGVIGNRFFLCPGEVGMDIFIKYTSFIFTNY